MEKINFQKKYNELVKDKYEGDYEYNRWFKDESLRAGYLMMEETFKRKQIKIGDYKDCLELGPGPGTWTKLLLEKNPKANYDLVDISSEMLNLAKKNLAQFSQLRFFESDFLVFNPDRFYDLFFSSRALEYLPDKERAVAKISELLVPGGRGFITTKTPRYFAYRLMGRKIPAMHQGQISPKELLKLLSSHGLKPLALFPVAVTVPFFHNPRLNWWAFKILSVLPWTPLNLIFCESYGLIFIKK